MWPFSRNRDRADIRAEGGGLSATEITVEALQREARGQTVDSAALALAEGCIGLWSRALASATVQPASMALAPVLPPILALAGRMLATRGNAIFLIEIRSGRAMLHPAAGWDPRGGYRPESRRYRPTMSGPDGTRTVTVHGDAVLHFAVNATEAEHWRGRGPLWRSRATANLAAEIERQATKEAKINPLRVLQADMPRGENAGERRQQTDERLKAGGVLVLPGLDMRGASAGERRAQQVLSIGPKPETAFEAMRARVMDDVCAAFGASPALFNPAGDGSGQREAWRRFWAGTVEPLGRLVEAELRAKLDPRARLSFAAMRASDEDGRSRAVSRRAAAFKTFMEAGIEREEALRLAGLEAD